MRRSEEEAFVSFVRAASPRLLRTAWLIAGDPTTAEELVQAALEKVYVRWTRIEAGQELAYTRRVMLNQHIDTGRRRARERLTDTPPETRYEDVHEDTAFLLRALSALTDRERQVVVMRYYADLSEAEVAAALGVSLGTVKSTASRGLAHLRRVLVADGGHHDR
jgi:RNA polymerase sigma-70 factor (sigma-E family)